jgi:hypothetical protein
MAQNKIICMNQFSPAFISQYLGKVLAVMAFQFVSLC